MTRWLVVWFFVLFILTSFGAAAGYTSGVYVRSSQTLYIGWPGALRVGAEAALTVVGFTIVIGIFIALIEWAGKKR